MPVILTARWPTATTASLTSPALFFFSFSFRFDRFAAGSAFAPHLRHCTRQTAAPLFLPSSVARTYASKKKNKKMPPKKEVQQEKVLLGRPGNNLKSGIVCEDLPFPAFLLCCT